MHSYLQLFSLLSAITDHGFQVTAASIMEHLTRDCIAFVTILFECFVSFVISVVLLFVIFQN